MVVASEQHLYKYQTVLPENLQQEVYITTFFATAPWWVF